jgi:hypothetical protein
MDTLNSTSIYADPARTPTDDEIRRTIALFKAKGLQVLLKPHVDIQTGEWRGYIAPSDVTAWFAGYTAFITHYADIAEASGASILCVGTELASLDGVPSYRANWSSVIAAVRMRYHGTLTYAANWDGYTPVTFWDLLDLAGIDAYFPLSTLQDPPVDSLVAGWSSYWDAGAH